MDAEPVGELEVVERHGAQPSRGRGLEVLPGLEVGLVEVVPDDHALRATDARDVAGRRGVPGLLQQATVVGQLEQVVGPPAGVVLGVDHGAVEERGLHVGDECRAGAGLFDQVEHFVRLHLDGHVALTEADQQVGLADPMRVVVDREATAGDDPRPAVERSAVWNSRASGSSASTTTAPSTPSKRAAKVSPSCSSPARKSFWRKGESGNGSHGCRTSSWTRWGHSLAKEAFLRGDLDGHKGIVPGGGDTGRDRRRVYPHAQKGFPHEIPGYVPQVRPDMLGAGGCAAWRADKWTVRTMAVQNLITQCRTVLLLVHELHLSGYQRLRAIPEMDRSGRYWKCAIAPVSLVSADHGARLLAENADTSRIPTYTSRDQYHYFEWTDIYPYVTPSELALYFVERFPQLAEAGRGSDWAYAGWYMEMLRLTQPDLFPYAAAKGKVADTYLPTASPVKERPTLRIPLPPPGEAHVPSELPRIHREFSGRSLRRVPLHAVRRRIAV